MNLPIYPQMTRYNRWMNERLMQTCSQLSDAERKQPRGAPFGSIHGLWNHLLLCDRAWLHRFENAPVPFSRLDEEICAAWEELQGQRAQTDDALDAGRCDFGLRLCCAHPKWRRAGGRREVRQA